MQKASFDTYASEYDSHFTHSKIGKLQRGAIYAKLFPLLNKQRSILEINCGTGFDAFVLAEKVGTYLATDISEKMIVLCKTKHLEKPLANLIFKQSSIQTIAPELKHCNFVFSNFGGLNCLSPDELTTFAANCAGELRASADLFFVIMGRKCLWERFYFLTKGEFKKAFRRASKGGIATKIQEQEFNTWYYSPKEIKKYFSPNFKIMSKGSIGLFVPPSYLNPFFEKKPRLLKVLAALDKIFTTFKWTANYADHYYIHLKKQN